MNFLEENNNLVNYYYFEKAFSDDEIKEIEELSKKYDLLDGCVGKDVDYSYRKTKITWIPQTEETQHIYTKIFDLVKKANKNMWNFNLSHFKENLQLGEYIEGEGHYDWHMDVGENASTRKLSVSIQLTHPEEYEGGDLNFFINRSEIKAPKTKGTVVIFPSFFMHKVSMVTKGVRKSLVIWVHGPVLN